VARLPQQLQASPFEDKRNPFAIEGPLEQGIYGFCLELLDSGP